MSVAYDERRNRRWRWESSHLARFQDAITERVDVQNPIVSPLSTSMEPVWLDAVERRMGELEKLNRDWDGRRSEAISRDAIEFVRSMLSVTMAPTTLAPNMVPLGHGGIQLLWASPSMEIEVEVIKPYDIIIYHFDCTTREDGEWKAEAEFSELARMLRKNFTR